MEFLHRSEESTKLSRKEGWRGRERSTLYKGWEACVCTQRVLWAQFWKWNITSTVLTPGHCERFPKSWSSPSQANDQFLSLRRIGPLTLPICRPWIIWWMEFSSADFENGRHAAWWDWKEPCAKSGQECLLISVKPLSARESCGKLMIQSHGLQTEHLKHFLFISSGENDGIKSGTKMRHTLWKWIFSMVYKHEHAVCNFTKKSFLI